LEAKAGNEKVKKLTSKEHRFISEYLKDSNGSQAAIRAGYSVKSSRVTACKLLTKANIHEELSKRQAYIAESCDITAEYILRSLKSIAEKCQQAVPVMEYDHGAREMKPTGAYEFDSTGANRALELLGKWRKLWTDRMEVEGVVNLSESMCAARARRSKA
jgi:phage terminase small subunit